MSDEAALDYRARLEAFVKDCDLLGGKIADSRLPVLRVALENVDAEHVYKPPAPTYRGSARLCRCKRPWPCPVAEVALEKLWNAILYHFGLEEK